MIAYYKKHIRTPGGIAFAWSLGCGVITHLFGLVNVMQNFDDIGNQPGGYGPAIILGRWLTEIMEKVLARTGFIYNLTTVNGLIFLFCLAISAGLLVSFLEVKRNTSAAMIGMLFSVFPTVISTMIYRHVTPAFGLGVLLAVFGAWVLRRHKFGLLFSSVSICLSLGIYQAYIPLTIGMFVLLLISQSLEEDIAILDLVRRGLYDCAALLLGLALYFVALRVCLFLTGTKLLDYRGVSTMGQIPLAELPGLIWRTIDDFLNILTRDYAGITVRKIQQITYCFLGILTAVMVGMILVRKRHKPLQCLATCVLIGLFPIAVNFIVIMCPGNGIYTLMVYGFVLVGCAPLIIYEKLPKIVRGGYFAHKMVGALLGFFVGLLIFSYAYYTNTNYMAQYYANRQIQNYVTSIVTQVRMTEGFDSEMEWALLGNIDDPLMESMWDEEANLGGNGSAEWILNHDYSRGNWFNLYIGYNLPLVSQERAEELINSENVKAMPCFPDYGSIQIVEDTVVIKFQELS